MLTPRNGRRKFRTPVHSPSSVLQCTSRTPSPSSVQSPRALGPRVVDRVMDPVVPHGPPGCSRSTRRCRPSSLPGTCRRPRLQLGRWPSRPPPGGRRPSPARRHRRSAAGLLRRCRGPVGCWLAAAAGRPGRRAGRLFSPAFRYISSASTTASPSGLRSSPIRAWSWSRCRRASSLPAQPNSRAICAVGVPWAIPRRISRIGRGGGESPAGRLP